MIKPTITVNAAAFDRKMAALRDNSPGAVSTALNRTAIYAKRREEEETRRVFQAPTPYTQRAFDIRWSTRNTLLAQVSVKNQAGGRLSPTHWLFAQVEGGARTQKAFEKALVSMGFLRSGHAAVPTRNAALDAYGNVSGGTIRSILSQLQRQTGSFVGPLKRRRGGAKALYFAVPDGGRSGNLGPGIYQRSGSGIRQIMVFTAALPRYTKRLDFYGVGKQAARDRFPIEARLAMKEVISLR